MLPKPAFTALGSNVPEVPLLVLPEPDDPNPLEENPPDPNPWLTALGSNVPTTRMLIVLN